MSEMTVVGLGHIRTIIKRIYKDFEELENRSCDGCIYKLQTTFKDYNCHKCSRFYDDKFIKDN